MPTPVSSARQCLTPEAAQALDEAVAVARRRGHAQTTSLHAVSALLALPSSALREACGRARNGAYSSRVQFKALELCLSVSLDRLPSSPTTQRRPDGDEPPAVSNSLMASIKRSQANQRRQPENYHLYQEQQQSSISAVKVELRNLILSILDDPVVSRAFGEAGFRSSDIKLAILRPVHHLLRYSNYKGPPMFLCNFTDGFSGGFDGDENCKRIGDVLFRHTGRSRNPLLIGVSALDALRDFSGMVQGRRGGNAFPPELSLLRVISIENEIMNHVTENYDEGLLKVRFEEVGRELEKCIGPGVVVNFGELKVLVGECGSVDAVGYIVRELGRLLEIHGGKVWLIGATARYETFLKFLSKFPSIEKDWDLQILPITSSIPAMAETYPKSSLMESFVPFGGFFSTPSDIKSPLRGSCQFVSCCHLCNENCDQEVTVLSKGGYTASVADQYQSSLPSWLQMSELSRNKGLDVLKAKDDSILPNAKVAGLKKWDDICHHCHYAQTSTHLLPNADSSQVGSQVPAVVGFQVFEDRKQSFGDQSSNNINASSTGSGRESVKSMNLQQNSTSKPRSPSTLISKSTNVNFLPKLCEKTSKIEDELGGLRSPPRSFSSSSVGDGWTSPTSATSVTTDLGLGTRSDFPWQFDQKDFKMLYTSLSNRIGQQEAAVSAVCQTIVHCRTRNEKRHRGSRGDIWFSFLGPDWLGKKKIAVSLAEIIYRSRENFICVDLSFQGGVINTNIIFDRHEMNGYDLKFRGKTIVDYIAEELSKKPLSVVYLENIDKADPVAQKSLSQAVKTGRFSDSHGREVSVGNAIFVTTSRFTDGNKILSFAYETSYYSEENVLRAKGWPIQILIGFDLGDNVVSHNSKNGSSNHIFVNKRKLVGTNETETIGQGQIMEMAKRAHKASNMQMDLNLPAEESDINEADYGNSDSDPVYENSKAWLEEFFKQVDKTVVFEPFDIDALAEKILKKIIDWFHKTIGSEGSLEIDSKVMEQILAAVCSLGNNRVDDWIEQVLSEAFAEVQKRYDLSSRSVVKLVTCEGQFPEEEAPGALLPARIIMN